MDTSVISRLVYRISFVKRYHLVHHQNCWPFAVMQNKQNEHVQNLWNSGSAKLQDACWQQIWPQGNFLIELHQNLLCGFHPWHSCLSWRFAEYYDFKILVHLNPNHNVFLCKRFSKMSTFLSHPKFMSTFISNMECWLSSIFYLKTGEPLTTMILITC